MPLASHSLKLKTKPGMRARDQLQDLEEAHVEDVVGEGEVAVEVSDKTVRHKGLQVVETPPRQNLPIPQPPQHLQPPLQGQQLLAHLKSQETLEIDETEEATEVVLEAQQSRGEAYSQWGLDDNLVAG